jgi:hypothetical protein
MRKIIKWESEHLGVKAYHVGGDKRSQARRGKKKKC